MTFPAVISLSICALWALVYLWLCFSIKQRALFIALTALGVFVTYFVSLGTLILYFELTIAWARSDAEIDGVVGGDGAKLVFTGMCLGPAASVFLAAVGLVTNVVGQNFVPPAAQPNDDGPSDEPMRPSASKNPYVPPGQT